MGRDDLEQLFASIIYIYICLFIAFGFWDLRPFDSIQSNCRHFQVPRSSQCQFHLHSTEAASSHPTQQLRFSGSGCAFFTTEEWPWCKAIGASRLHDMSVLLIWKIKWPVFKNMKIIYIMEYERISSFMHIVGLCQCCCGLPCFPWANVATRYKIYPFLEFLSRIMSATLSQPSDCWLKDMMCSYIQMHHGLCSPWGSRVYIIWQICLESLHVCTTISIYCFLSSGFWHLCCRIFTL